MSIHPTDTKLSYYLEPVTGILALESLHGEGTVSILNLSMFPDMKKPTKDRAIRKLVSYITHTPVLRLNKLRKGLVKLLDETPYDLPDFLSFTNPDSKDEASIFWLYYSGTLPGLNNPGMVSSEKIKDIPHPKANAWTTTIDMNDFIFWKEKSLIPKKGLNFIRDRAIIFVNAWMDDTIEQHEIKS